jgi:hypothetical protein
MLRSMEHFLLETLSSASRDALSTKQKLKVAWFNRVKEERNEGDLESIRI